MILVIADRNDAHADAVERVIPSENRFRLNLDIESLERTWLEISPDGAGLIATPSGTLDLSNISVVWARRVYIDQTTLPEPCSITSQEYTTRKMWLGEWIKTLFWLYQSLEGRRWLNSLRPSLRAENKFLQMQAAKRVGLKIPRGISSNRKAALADFARGCSLGSALKSLAQDFYSIDGQPLGLFVNKVTAGDFASFGDEQECPVFLQEYVPKAFEVRITSVLGSHFACRISSQESDRACVDWRRYDLPRTPHAAIEVPRDVGDRLDALLRNLGLEYGASDFIVTPSGDWVFLEVNPSGQWLWIEHLTGLPISARIAHCLLSWHADASASQRDVQEETVRSPR